MERSRTTRHVDFVAGSWCSSQDVRPTAFGPTHLTFASDDRMFDSSVPISALSIT